MKQEPEINIYKTPDEMFVNAVEKISSLINFYINRHSRCSFVLSGGKTPEKLFDILSTDNTVQWDRVFFFWADERCVPPDSPESNYKMANDHLLSKINVPQNNIFRIPAEKPHDEAAAKYEAAMKHFFEGETIPSFDIILLGVGNDGHTASLFPGTTVTENTEKWAKAVYVEKLQSWRITLTFPVINNSKNIIFLVQGNEKSGVIKEIFNNSNTTLPAQKVKPKNGELFWFLDEEASSLITT